MASPASLDLSQVKPWDCSLLSHNETPHQKIDNLKALVRQNPTNLRLYKELCELYLSLNQIDEGTWIFCKGLGMSSQFVHYFHDAQRIQPCTFQTLRCDWLSSGIQESYMTLWNGKEKLNQKTICLIAPQDRQFLLFFLRFLPALLRFNPDKIVLSVPDHEMQELVAHLLTPYENVEVTLPCGIPQTDFFLPIGLLPVACALTVQEVMQLPSFSPKLERDLSHKGLKIGIFLSTSMNPYDEGYEVPFEQLFCLKGLRGAQLKLIECCYEKKFPSDLKIEDVRTQSTTLLEKAKELANCDVALVSDGIGAHLAAILGIETALLLPKKSHLLWSQDEEGKSILYQNVDLFQQKEAGDWQEVVTRLYCDLERVSSNSCFFDFLDYFLRGY